MKVLHTADLHFGNKPDSLEEVITTSNNIISVAERELPDIAILAGDTVDEHMGAIRLDSATARAAVSFVSRMAEICPVVIIRGTKSHDRESPYIFSHLHSRYPIHVATEIQQVAWVPVSNAFLPLADALEYGDPFAAVLTLVPSIDKSYLMSHFDGSIKSGNLQTRELLHDLFAGLGLVNDTILHVPRILVTHGMVTGAQFSTGQVAIGEDLEFGTNDLLQAKCDYYALGHVHKFQRFPGNICYSGSPGRLNFGETEEKGFLMVEFDGQTIQEIKFHSTPARRFALHSVEWGEDGKAAILAEADKCAASCQGADVRFRYTIPEEEKHAVDRDQLSSRFLEAGARRVKIEATIIPKQRTRAAGISRITTLPEKVRLWGSTTGTTIPDRVLLLASIIEGLDVDELVAEAENGIAASVPQVLEVAA